MWLCKKAFECSFPPCPGSARIGLSFPSSGGEALAGLFIYHAEVTSGRKSAQARDSRLTRVLCHLSALTAVSVDILLCSLLLLLLL